MRWWYAGGLFLTSHNWVEIYHIRLVFFQITFESQKRGLPGFQLYMILCLGCKSKQPRQDRVDSSDSESCIVIGPQTWWRQNKQKTENRLDPLLTFNPNLEKHQPYMVNLCLIVWCQRGPPAYHHQPHVHNKFSFDRSCQ